MITFMKVVAIELGIDSVPMYCSHGRVMLLSDYIEIVIEIGLKIGQSKQN